MESLVKITENLSEKERVDTLKSALNTGNVALIEFALYLAREHTAGFETELVIHGIKTGNKELIVANFPKAKKTETKMESYVSIALKEGNAEIMQTVFDCGGGKLFAKRHALSMGRIKSLAMLEEMGVKFNSLDDLDMMVKGATGGLTTISWLLERQETPIDRVKYERIIKTADIKGQDITAAYLREFLRDYEEKFTQKDVKPQTEKNAIKLQLAGKAEPTKKKKPTQKKETLEE